MRDEKVEQEKDGQWEEEGVRVGGRGKRGCVVWEEGKEGRAMEGKQCNGRG